MKAEKIEYTYEIVECQECENGTRYLSNLLSEICSYCEGTGMREVIVL